MSLTRKLSHFLFMLAFVGSGGISFAEIVPVRSGEHDGFTRLALDLPRRLEWQLHSDEASSVLSFDGGKVEFDFEDTFRRITADRVSNLAAVPDRNALAIELNCSCEIKVFRLGDRMLVIDIHDPDVLDPPTGSNPDMQNASLRRESIQVLPRLARLRFPFELQETGTEHALAFSSGLGNVGSSDAGNKAEKPSADSVTLPNLPTLNATVEQAEYVTQSERRLIEQLGRAASQGLLTPQDRHLWANSRLESDQVGDPGANDASTPDVSSESGSAKRLGINLIAETSIDRDFLHMFQSQLGNETDEVCFSDDLLDVARWASGEPFGKQVGHLRAHLIGEFDRADTAIAKDLAKLYIHFGFGAEALYVIDIAKLDEDSERLLIQLGQILEYGRADNPDVFANQFACDSNSALWAILSQDPVSTMASPNSQAILRAFNALPVHLRTYIGPILNERLISIDQTATAAPVQRILERGVVSPDHRVQLAEANIQIANGQFQAATENLDAAIKANSEQSPQAVIQLIESKLASHLPIELATAELAGAYALEYRNHPIGAQLKHAQIRALSALGDFTVAFSELETFSETASEDVTEDLLSFAITELAEDADDIEFLKFALSELGSAENKLSVIAGNKAAERLIKLGFADEATILLRSDADGQDGRTRRLLRAQSALAQSKPELAESEILGLEGPEPDYLRARARAMSGDHSGASELFSTLGKFDLAQEQAWLGSEWDSLSRADDGLLPSIANIALGKPETQTSQKETPGGSLAQSHVLLEQSRASRVALDALLARMSVEGIPKEGE